MHDCSNFVVVFVAPFTLTRLKCVVTSISYLGAFVVVDSSLAPFHDRPLFIFQKYFENLEKQFTRRRRQESRISPWLSSIACHLDTSTPVDDEDDDEDDDDDSTAKQSDRVHIPFVCRLNMNAPSTNHRFRRSTDNSFVDFCKLTIAENRSMCPVRLRLLTRHAMQHRSCFAIDKTAKSDQANRRWKWWWGAVVVGQSIRIRVVCLQVSCHLLRDHLANRTNKTSVHRICTFGRQFVRTIYSAGTARQECANGCQFFFRLQRPSGSVVLANQGSVWPTASVRCSANRDHYYEKSRRLGSATLIVCNAEHDHVLFVPLVVRQVVRPALFVSSSSVNLVNYALAATSNSNNNKGLSLRDSLLIVAYRCCSRFSPLHRLLDSSSCSMPLFGSTNFGSIIDRLFTLNDLIIIFRVCVCVDLVLFRARTGNHLCAFRGLCVDGLISLSKYKHNASRLFHFSLEIKIVWLWIQSTNSIYWCFCRNHCGRKTNQQNKTELKGKMKKKMIKKNSICYRW